MLNLALLRIFISVAENSSFTKAAGEMYRSQSAISMQIKRLEDYLGVPLFERSGKTVKLSPEGEIFLAYARKIVHLVDEAASAVHIKKRTSVVRLGCIEDYAARVVPKVLAKFWKSHSGVQIEVRTGETDQILERLGLDFDLVIASHPKGDGDGTLLCSDRLVWACSKTHSPQNEVPLPIALRSDDVTERQWATSSLNAIERPWRCTYLASGIGTLQSAVEDGLAIGLFKERAVSGDLRILGPAENFPPLPEVDIVLHTAPDLVPGSNAAHLAASLIAALSGRP